MITSCAKRSPARTLSAVAQDTVAEAAGFVDDIAFSASSCLHAERTRLAGRLVAEGESGLLRLKTGNVPETHLPPAASWTAQWAPASRTVP